MKFGDVMRESHDFDTNLKRCSEISGNLRKISIRRSSQERTLCTDEGSSLSPVPLIDAVVSIGIGKP